MAAGRQSQRIYARRNLTSYTYDAGDRLLTRQYPDGQRTTFAYDESGNRTRLENHAVAVTIAYDPLNRREDVTTEYNV